MKRTPDPGFPLADGQHYLDVFAHLHEVMNPKWYLEVGTQTGASLKLAKARSISVDPVYHLREEVMGTKPELAMIQDTSDAFFDSGYLKARKIKVDLAFLDGMHLFEYLLRDFIHTEGHMAKGGTIVLHDCLPWTANMTTRNRGDCKTNAWTGDVWKLVPVLQKYRPDLEIEILDAAPTGLVLVSNLDAKNKKLLDNYRSILEEFQELRMEDYGPDRYFREIKITAVAQSKWMAANAAQLKSGWQDNPHISIKVAAPTADVMPEWGDYHFARSLANALGRLGHAASIHAQDTWYDDQTSGGIDLVIRGKSNFRRQAGRTCLYWSISKGLRPINLQAADHVFVASAPLLQSLQAEHGEEGFSLLPQAFDADVMHPRKTTRGEGLVFVGRNRKGFERDSVRYAAQSGKAFTLHGPGWGGSDWSEFHRAEYIPNGELTQTYGEADIVLNDHTPVMKESGFLSNRIFDILASGAVPITDDVGWLPEDIAPFVYLFHDEASFTDCLARAETETERQRKKRLTLAREMRMTHSFDARAKTILAKLAELQPEERVAAE
ncbi:MAG: class I SAM-dependent methyltransferase [Pseudomonadota bacterium]